MGVPDFVKFVARSSPGALCRVPRGGSRRDPLVFDFILIDATNAAQTLGLDTLRSFLHPDHLVARSALIFALDSQRDRSGTARAHRHALVGISDLDVQVQRLCGQLADAYRAYQRSNKTLGASVNPCVLMSGRGVAGEADYKLLDLQRSLTTCAMANGATLLPTFLFISEDSDVLCGALCGPAPQQVSIATKLQDVLFEPSILRLDCVLVFVASCTDAFYSEREKAAAAAAAKAKMTGKSAAAGTLADSVATAPARKNAESHGSDEEVEVSVKDTAVAMVAAPSAPRDKAVVRRRKQDGPMVATGVRIELADSSDEDLPERAGTTQRVATTSSTGATEEAAHSEVKKGCFGDGKCVDEGSAVPTEGELLVSAITQTGCVDMVFLFIIVMGNAVNVPSLVRGATKVDAGSFWQAYCRLKYKCLSSAEAERGRALLTTSINTHSTNKGSLVLNCHFLHSILDAVHYADTEPRPPGEEEKNAAIVYLSNAVYATLRYIVGCNLEKTPVLQHTFLDSRTLSEIAIPLPSLSALMWVLGQEPERTFSFPLYGLARKELLAAASGGAAAGKETSKAVSRLAALYPTFARDASSSAGHLDVADHLVAPAASNAWAVRGARASSVSLATLMQSFTSGTDRTPSTLRSGHSAAAVRPGQLPSVTEMLKTCLQTVSPASLAKSNLLFYLMTVWRYALGLGVRRMATLTKKAELVAKAEGGEPAFPPAKVAEGTTGVLGASPAGGHYVYSFELRRMAPVLQVPAAQPPTTITGASGDCALTGAATGKASWSSENSAVEQAILAAVGVSFDYSKAWRTPANVMQLPHSAADERDVAGLQRPKKVPKKERTPRVFATPSAAGKRSNATKNDGAPSGNDDGSNAATVPSKESSRTKNGSFKVKKRLGKHERLRQQKTNDKVAATNASGSVTRLRVGVKAATL
ncbi:hypothetical protein JIQ42_00155 [Leishmania sp. Namibia]|uniref:hypothetical protein n=1 Tax=Leishmania sp. Namibia TaxID=2802991 RepID=UPI001B518E18|nr:hypothetical protein JIQ42_00155 [Leishmania sp. Namibia]